MPWRYDNRHEICERICQGVQRGRSISAVLRDDGMPDHRTLSRWAAKDAGLRFRLEEVKAEGRAIEAQFWRRQPFNAAVAQDLLKQVMFGRRVVDLVREPAFPNRDTLDRWKRENPAFAADLREAVRFARFERRNRHPYDEAKADRLIQTVHGGAQLSEVLGREGMPTETDVKLWRKRRPDFDYAVRMAKLGGIRRRAAARRKEALVVTPKIVARLLEGRSLRQVGMMPDMPHWNTLYRWMRERPDFAREVRRACEFRDFMMADQVGAIAEAMRPETEALAAAQIGALKRRVGQMSWKPRGA